MSSIYRVGKSPKSSSHIEIKFEVKNGKPHWFILYDIGREKYQLIWHSFPILISHLYVFFGLSKMLNKDYEEKYNIVKNHIYLISGEDIIAEHYLTNKENSNI